MAITRDKLSEPDPPPAAKSIAFLHPGYSDGSNKFLTLLALDCGGIHYGTALTFCGMVAGNSFNTGFFAKSREAEQETSIWDSVLTGSTFYFFVSTDRRCKYPIYASFNDWQFPSDLPPQWQEYTIPPSPDARQFIGLQAQLQERDRSCRLTLDGDGCEVAHLVPKSEVGWFIRNQMIDFVNAGDPQAIDHHANAIFLRPDLHHLMDRKVWVPMLKEGRLVLCCICKPSAQPLSSRFRSRYQNLALQDLKDVSKECIFARIAWAVIPLVRPFLQLRWTKSQEMTAIIDGDTTAKELSSAQLGAKYNLDNQARSRTRSPTKRTRSSVGTPTSNADSDATNNGNDTIYCSWPSFKDSAYHKSSDDEGCEIDENGSSTRGRKRRRISIEIDRVGNNDYVDGSTHVWKMETRAVGHSQ